jgi:hypothetical protein
MVQKAIKASRPSFCFLSLGSQSNPPNGSPLALYSFERKCFLCSQKMSHRGFLSVIATTHASMKIEFGRWQIASGKTALML